MIISYEDNYIFLHCRKTAGSAIKCYLNRFLGKNDIQVGGWHNAINNGGKFNLKFFKDLTDPRCSLNTTTWKIILSSIYERRVSLKVLNKIHKKRYHNFRNPGHETAKEIKEFDKHAWSNFFKFCFVRNPYEKEVSDYIWKVESKGKTTKFIDFLKKKQGKNAHLYDEIEFPYKNKLIYEIQGQVAVDYIAKYENIIEEMKYICKKVGIPFGEEGLPEAKNRKDYRYRSYYGEKEKKIVESIYSEEIKQFGYTF